MIVPSNRVRIVVATRPVDFRRGHDGLAAVVKRVLRRDPFTGTVFVFRAKRADRLKLIFWDGTGLVMARDDRAWGGPDPPGPIRRAWSTSMRPGAAANTPKSSSTASTASFRSTAMPATTG